MKKMNKITLSFTIFILFLLGVWQFHEYQHYKDFKDNECTDISYQVIRVKAYCNETTKMQELIDYRDKQVLSLWLFS